MWITVAAVGATSMLTFALSPAHADPAVGPHVAMQKGRAKPQGGVKNLIDHGGPILPAADLYAIWWARRRGSRPTRSRA
jgi:hypothetical protein